jgi:hypothetical protein
MTEDQAKECGVEDAYNKAIQFYPDHKLPSIDARWPSACRKKGTHSSSVTPTWTR